MQKLDELRQSPHWSYSALNIYLNICQLQYFFRYIEKAEVEQTSANLVFGKAFHAALSQQADVARKGNTLNISEITDLFKTYFMANVKATENIKFKQGEDADSMLAQSSGMFNAVLDQWTDLYNVRSIGQGFRIEVPFLDKPLIGEFDLVVEDGRDVCIVDWKTSASRWPAGKADGDLQATVFSYAYKKIHGEYPLFRFDVITKTKTPSYDMHYTSRGIQEFKRFEFLAHQAQNAINKGIFLPSETSFACADCPYKQKCRQWHLEGEKNGTDD